MRRTITLIAAFAAAAVSLSACEVSAEPVAARVDGTVISQSSLNAAMQSALSDPGYKCYIESQGGASIVGAGADTFSATFAANELSFLASAIALHNGLQKMGATTGSVVAQAVANLELMTQFTPQQGSGCTATAAQVVRDLSPAYRAMLQSYYSDEATLAAHILGVTLTNAGVRKYEEANPKSTTVDCIDAVLVSTEAKAQGVVTQLQKGAQFAAVAKANSIDAASAAAGGRIGCINPEQLTSSLSAAVEALKPGEISGPVPFQTDWVVLEVASRSFPSPANAMESVVASESATAKFATALDHAVDGADIQVSAQFGRVTIGKGQVQIAPLAGPKQSLLPNLTALEAPAPASS